MSYIPKYLLKRLVPKDALRMDTVNGIRCAVLAVKNVISPLEVPAEIPQLPKDLNEFVRFSIDGEQGDITKLMIRAHGKIVTLNNLNDAAGETVDVGEILELCYPKELTPGEHTVKVEINQNGNWTAIEVTRELS